MLLYGKNSVFERVKANPASIKKIFLEEKFSQPQLENLIRAKRIPFKYVSLKQLQKIKKADLLQGVVAEVEEFIYADFLDLIRESSPRLSFLVLDRVYDPQNLGAIIRTAACSGGFAVVIPKHRACDVTETVLHVAQGGENFVPVVRATNITNILLEAKKNGYWVVGSGLEGGCSLDEASLPFPLCFVLGSEGSGIRYGIQKHLDLKVNIPMEGAPLSFNVATSTAVFCYEISRQRRRLGPNKGL
jgi:23S rRNA (guanosine2251-2'-O)-methyltransferase